MVFQKDTMWWKPGGVDGGKQYRVSRRGEGGGCGVGWAFMVARGGWDRVPPRWGDRTRATMKAHPSALHPPSPLRNVIGFLLAWCLLQPIYRPRFSPTNIPKTPI